MTRLLLPTALLLAGTLFAHAARAETYAVRGMVRDTGGEPVAGGDVYLLHGFDVHTTTLDGGAFSFPPLAPGPIHLTVFPVEKAVAGYSGFLGDDLEISLRCAPAGVITLRVTGTDFRPLGGVRPTMVVVNDRFMIPIEPFAEKGFPAFRSDDEGKLRLPFLPENGHARAILRHFDFADLQLAYLPVTPAVQQVVLYPGIEVEGRVVQDGEGLNGALVSIYPEAANDYREAVQVTTDPDGFFLVRLRNGDYYFAAHHPDGATAAPTLTQVVEVAEAGDSRPSITLEAAPQRTITGTIRYPDGSPCHGAQILYRVEEVVTADTYTTKQGTFRLRAASPVGVLNVTPPPGFMMREMADIPVDMQDATEARMDPVVLEAIPAIEGRVLDDNGDPVARALIASVDLSPPLWAVSDEAGRFHIRVFEEPQDGAVTWRAEHPERFLRDERRIALDGDDETEFRLRRFSPDQEQRPAPSLGNDLDSLVNKEAPDLVCAEWFNTGNGGFPEDALDEAGEALPLAAFAGKVTVLYFWGGFDTTPDGLNALSHMQAVAASLAEVEDVCVVGIHDATSLPEEVALYLEDYNIAFPVGLDEGLSETFAAYRVGHIPQTVLIDKGGKVRYYQTHDRLLELIKVLRRRG